MVQACSNGRTWVILARAGSLDGKRSRRFHSAGTVIAGLEGGRRIGHHRSTG
jgi:hypothetical protein